MILAHDVTAREIAEEKLRSSEENLSITLQSIGDAVIATDAAGVITRMNFAAEHMTGWTQAEATGRPLSEVFHIINALTRTRAIDPVQLVMTSGEIVGLANHTALLARDGREYQIADSAAPIRNPAGQIVGVVLVFRDVTEAYSARQALATTAELLERTGEVAKVGGWEVDLQTMKLFWSIETFRIHEVDPPNVPTLEQGIALFAPEARPIIQAAMHAAINSGTPYDLELPKVTAKGRAIWVRTQGTPVMENGKVTKLIGAFHDITERKRAELALRESEAFNVAILDSVAAEIAVLDSDGNIIAVNEPWRRFALENGVEANDSARQTGAGINYLAVCQLSSDTASNDALAAHDGIRAVLDGRSPSFTLEYPCHSPRQKRWFSMSATPLGNGRKGAVVAHTNITARVEAETARTSLEAQLRESQKMEAIGTLAGGIAHDFNNILATILGNADLARQDLGNNPHALESLEEIRKAAARARDLVQQILSFSRRQPIERKPILLTPIIEESVRLLRATLPPRVVLDVHCDADVPVVLANATQIQQVMMNLVTNAVFAMRGGSGRIGIRLDTVTLDAALAVAHPALYAMHARQPGRTVRLAVSDNGMGMDADTLARIFEPFFTTKAVNEGTGLGLSVVHGIVQAHKGAIEVDSLEQTGSTFTLYLSPAEVQYGEPRPEKIAASSATMPLEDSDRHILYIDDDESLVFLVTRVLERYGFRISGYVSQREALVALRADPTSYDLVVTDYNMPGMSGLDVAREVRTIRADLPVVVASGFIDETLRAQASGAGVWEFIFKANSVEDLCEAIRRLAQTIGRKS